MPAFYSLMLQCCRQAPGQHAACALGARWYAACGWRAGVLRQVALGMPSYMHCAWQLGVHGISGISRHCSGDGDAVVPKAGYPATLQRRRDIPPMQRRRAGRLLVRRGAPGGADRHGMLCRPVGNRAAVFSGSIPLDF